MITNYTQLTGKYLKANRRRTILTIIGIILSVALISSIGFFIKGMQESQIRDVKNSSGSFHLVYTKNVTADLVAKATGNPKVKRSGLYSVGATYPITGKITITETITSDQALELLPYRIKEGRFPKTPEEVAVEKWALRYIDQNAKPGDTISLHNHKYVLAGILEDQVRNQIKNQAILLTRSNNIDLTHAALLVEVNPKTNIRKTLQELEQLTDKSSYQENSNLLRVLGVRDNKGGFKGEFLVFSVIIGIVVISTIAVIYNSFQISVVERVKQFGLLRTIGTTPRQIRKIVFREATVLAVIAIPLGLLFGVLAIYAISYTFALLVDGSIIIARTALSWKVVLISIGLGLFSIYASAFIPAMFAGRISPLVAVSSRALIAKEKIKRRRSWIFGKLFGFEGELASKNIKRNPKRYRITVFSIVISVVLFVTFTSFMNMVLNVTETYNETTKLHFAIYSNLGDNNRAISNEIIEQVRAIPVVSKVYQQYNPLFANTVFNSARELPELQKMNNIYKHVTWQGSSKTYLHGTIDIYDQESLEAAKNYITAGSINPEKMSQENGVIIIDRNMIANKSTRRTFFGPIADLKVGDEIYLELNAPMQQDQIKPGQGMFVTGDQATDFGKGKVQKVKVLGIVKDDPFSFIGSQNSLKMITTEEVGKRLGGLSTIQPTTLNIVINDPKNEDIAKAELEKAIQSDPGLNVVNFIDSNRMQKSTILMLQILLYGFVIVVSCIGCVNIINTITTNMILRKREFAMLKSIGITQKGLRKMITLEGMLYGVVGTIYGSILACGFSYLMYIGLMDIRESVWRIPWGPMGIAGVAAIAIGYLSVLSPLRRIKRENLIDVVREDY